MQRRLSARQAIGWPLALLLAGFTALTAQERPQPQTVHSSTNLIVVDDDRLKHELRSVLPGAPGARRTFARDDEIAAFVEAYTGGGSKPRRSPSPRP